MADWVILTIVAVWTYFYSEDNTFKALAFQGVDCLPFAPISIR